MVCVAFAWDAWTNLIPRALDDVNKPKRLQGTLRSVNLYSLDNGLAKFKKIGNWQHAFLAMQGFKGVKNS
jgi:hypothetical protein